MPSFNDVDADGLRRVCAGVVDWVDQADDEDRRLALEARLRTWGTPITCKGVEGWTRRSSGYSRILKPSDFAP